jgi:hypothetical protein
MSVGSAQAPGCFRQCATPGSALSAARPSARERSCAADDVVTGETDGALDSVFGPVSLGATGAHAPHQRSSAGGCQPGRVGRQRTYVWHPTTLRARASSDPVHTPRPSRMSPCTTCRSHPLPAETRRDVPGSRAQPRGLPDGRGPLREPTLPTVHDCFPNGTSNKRTRSARELYLPRTAAAAPPGGLGNGGPLTSAERCLVHGRRGVEAVAVDPVVVEPDAGETASRRATCRAWRGASQLAHISFGTVSDWMSVLVCGRSPRSPWGWPRTRGG